MKIPSSLQQSLDRWSNLSLNQSMAGFMHFMRQNNLSYSQLSVLTRLDHHGSADLITLSRELQISKAGAGQLVHRMEEAGWVALVPNHQDGRSKLVALTERGMQLVNGSLQARAQWLLDRAAQLSAQEQQEMEQAVNCLFHLLDLADLEISTNAEKLQIESITGEKHV